MPGLWTDCGWANDPDYALYVMGSDARYLYWSLDPTLSASSFLWKDDNMTAVAPAPQLLPALYSSDVFWRRYVYSDVFGGVHRPPRLLVSRLTTCTRAHQLFCVIGADLEMGFLSELLQRSLVSVGSMAFLLDIWRATPP